MKCVLAAVLIVMVGIFGVVPAAWAQDLNDQKFAVGFRSGVFLADGEPSNDLPMFGIYGRYNWSEKWNGVWV